VYVEKLSEETITLQQKVKFKNWTWVKCLVVPDSSSNALILLAEAEAKCVKCVSDVEREQCKRLHGAV